MANKQGRRFRNRHNAVAPYGLRLCAAAVVCALWHPAQAQDEVAAFRLTGIEGFAEVRYREDDEVLSSPGSSSYEDHTLAEEEIFVLTHSYVYHPNFLKMDLGIGPVFSQTRLESTSGDRSDDSLDYNATARLHFLDEKPYPLLLYYEKDNPTVALTVTDRFVEQSELYGFDFQIKQPVLPFKLTLAASNHKTAGEGFETRIRDDVNQATVRAELPSRHDGYTQFIFNTTDSRSESGYLSDPPVLTTTKTDSYTLDSRLYLGDNAKYQLNNYLVYTDQTGVSPLQEWRYTPDLRVLHSDKLESYYRFNYSNSDQVVVTTENIGASAGFRYNKKENFDITGELHTDNTKSTGLDLNSYGGLVAGTYIQPYSFGELSLHAGWNLDFYDRVASDAVPVVDLVVNLTGTNPEFLPHDNIDRSTIRVFRVFSGGAETELTVGVDTICDGTIDILAKTINARTTIENCNGATDGDIVVKVDYYYDPGGTVAFTNFIQTYQANLQIYKKYNLYARYRDSNASIKSGTPTQALDEYRNTQVGVRVDYPVLDSARVGGEVQYEYEIGTLNTFNRNTAQLYVQFGIFNGVFYANTQHVTIDYANTDEDIDQTLNTLQFRIRPWNRVLVTAELSTENETGGSTDRKTQIQSLTAEWRIRQLIMQAEARHVNDVYEGASERARSLLRFLVRREF